MLLNAIRNDIQEIIGIFTNTPETVFEYTNEVKSFIDDLYDIFIHGLKFDKPSCIELFQDKNDQSIIIKNRDQYEIYQDFIFNSLNKQVKRYINYLECL